MGVVDVIWRMSSIGDKVDKAARGCGVWIINPGIIVCQTVIFVEYCAQSGSEHMRENEVVKRTLARSTRQGPS